MKHLVLLYVFFPIMSLISGEIGVQGFERVTDRVAEILADEFANQVDITSDEDINLTVWLERFWAFDSNELPAINVSVRSGQLDNHNQGSTDGTYLIDIECHTKAADGDEGDELVKDDGGDSRAKIKLRKIMGVARAILENPVYKTLGFEPPFIMNRRVINIEISNMEGRDLKNIAAGTVVLEVRCQETTDLIEPSLIAGYETTVTLDESEKGYFFVVY